jgi:uncharacterized protein YbjT (DUF2867 family)
MNGRKVQERNMEKRVLVVGATGILGGTVCARLRADGWQVRALARAGSSAEKVKRLTASGVEVVEGDLKDRGSLDRACIGVPAVVSTASSTLSRQAGDSIETVDRDGQLQLVDAAAAAAVRRFVLVSFPPISVPFPLQDAKRAVEERLKASGMSYTILQPTVFMDVWLSPALGFDIAGGTAQIFGGGDRPISWIAVQDVARFTVAALTAPGAENAVLQLGGPEALTPLEVVRQAEQVTGKKMTLTRVPEEAVRGQYQSASDPLQKSFAALTLSLIEGSEIDMQPAMSRIPLKGMRTVGQYLRGE